MTYDEEKIRGKLKESLSKEDFLHSLQVQRTAIQLAERFRAGVAKASLAGLLHDYGKAFSNGELVRLARKVGYPVHPVEKAFPYLLHAPVGARLIPKAFGVRDSEVIRSIENHTIGSFNMSRLDKIIYLSDVIEPSRTYPGLDEIRALAKHDLDQAFKVAYKHVLLYLITTDKLIHPLSVEVWNRLQH